MPRPLTNHMHFQDGPKNGAQIDPKDKNVIWVELDEGGWLALIHIREDEFHTYRMNPITSVLEYEGIEEFEKI